MIRLLLWFFRFIVIGQRRAKPAEKHCVRCQSRGYSSPERAEYCALKLCANCCEPRCDCLAHRVAEERQLRREVQT